MSELDLSKAKKKPIFSVPPSAAPGLTGTPPLPVGAPMTLKKVSPGERAVLERYGWKDGDPVPSNLHQLIDAATAAQVEASDLDNLPPPVSLKTPALKVPDVVPVEKLSPEKQAKYAEIAKSFADAKELMAQKETMTGQFVPGGEGVDAGSINNAIRAAHGNGPQLDIVDDREEHKPAGETKAKKDNHFCTHCGWPEAIPDTQEVSEVDKINFLQALLGLKSFEKSYRGFNNLLTVTIRTLLPGELDLIFRQIFTDRQKGRTVNPSEEAENLARYKTALQIVTILGPGLNAVLPRSIDEWEELVGPASEGDTLVYEIWKHFERHYDKTETMHRVLIGLRGKFDSIVAKLEDNIDNENFGPAIE
jgi:hypothetical protein